MFIASKLGTTLSREKIQLAEELTQAKQAGGEDQQMLKVRRTLSYFMCKINCCEEMVSSLVRMPMTLLLSIIFSGLGNVWLGLWQRHPSPARQILNAVLGQVTLTSSVPMLSTVSGTWQIMATLKGDIIMYPLQIETLIQWNLLLQD